MAQNIILTGFMGVGKTSVSRALAKELNLRQLDLDEMIEAKAGVKIAEIFEKSGEKTFRDYETKTLEEVLGMDSIVLATGGGVLEREENRKRLAGARVVNLNARWDVIMERVNRNPGKRPLVLKGEEHLKERFAARKALYEGVERQVDTSGKSPLEVAREIIAMLGEKKV